MDSRFKLPLTALLVTAPSLLYAAETLIFALDVIRHGDRTPILQLPKVHNTWKEGPGQLTAEGMQQEFQLGSELRKRYIEQTHLLPERYEYGTMYVRSTDYDRTLMSAQSFLLGLYPLGSGPNKSDSTESALPNGFQPIPIFSAPSKTDDVILQNVSHDDREKLMAQYVYSLPEWQKKNNELKAKYPLWSNQTGIQIDDLDDLQMVGDTLYVNQVHKASMPEGMSAEDINTIISSSAWAFMAEERPKEVAKAYSTKIMGNIVNFLDKGSKQNSKLKYVLLSGHDTTIAGIMSFMGVPLDKAPRYASNLNFSLYSADSGHYLVKLTYNGSPVSIPACGGAVCELQQFVDYVKSA